jgi:RHS repeat-associated protein
MMKRVGANSFYLYDGLGSVIALSNNSGNLVEQYSYDVFGYPNTVSSVGNRFMFTGREYDNEYLMGLYYYRARYYRPSIGRFTSRDLVIVSCLAGIVESIPF